MGLDADGLKFLLLGRAEGVDFSRTATIGRQWIYRLDEAALQRIFRAFGMPLAADEGRRLLEEEDGFAETVFRRLGAVTVAALDASDYEGSQIIHDMNEQIPPQLRRRFSTVLDGGSLEHVFNFPVALANCMEMVETGGHLVVMTPANNYFGHGFYQTGPELYYRALTPRNGFEVDRVLLREARWRERWYEVADPAVLGRRLAWMSSLPVGLYVRARRVNDAPSLVTMPQVSDYRSRWEGEWTPPGDASGPGVRAAAGRHAIRLLKQARERLPGAAREVIGNHLDRRRPVYDRRAYRRVSPESLARRPG
jgi:hypothetical protein